MPPRYRIRKLYAFSQLSIEFAPFEIRFVRSYNQYVMHFGFGFLTSVLILFAHRISNPTFAQKYNDENFNVYFILFLIYLIDPTECVRSFILIYLIDPIYLIFIWYKLDSIECVRLSPFVTVSKFLAILLLTSLSRAIFALCYKERNSEKFL